MTRTRSWRPSSPNCSTTTSCSRCSNRRPSTSVALKDQWGSTKAKVGYPRFFAAPSRKWHGKAVDGRALRMHLNPARRGAWPTKLGRYDRTTRVWKFVKVPAGLCGEDGVFAGGAFHACHAEALP